VTSSPAPALHVHTTHIVQYRYWTVMARVCLVVPEANEEDTDLYVNQVN
jgi:hypothetical protein